MNKCSKKISLMFTDTSFYGGKTSSRACDTKLFLI
jgi:hypothetical protein